MVTSGKALQEAADALLIGIRDKEGNFVQKGFIGDGDRLLVPGLEIRKLTSTRHNIDEHLVLKYFGAEGLVKVMIEKPVVSYRHKEV